MLFFYIYHSVPKTRKRIIHSVSRTRKIVLKFVFGVKRNRWSLITNWAWSTAIKNDQAHMVDLLGRRKIQERLVWLLQLWQRLVFLLHHYFKLVLCGFPLATWCLKWMVSPLPASSSNERCSLLLLCFVTTQCSSSNWSW